SWCDTVLAGLGIRTIYYEPMIGAGIDSLIGDKTRAVFMESPGSLTFEVQDVPAICGAAKARGLVTLFDNTWATPFLFPAIAAGVDLSILACTKYVVGHADVMLGSVTASPDLWRKLERTSRAFGQHCSPDDAFLGARGLRTLGVRLRRHEESGLKVALWLAEQKQVARVLHPALESCPGHDIWSRDFKGASGLFSFILAGGSDEDRVKLIDGLDHFGIGYSWGGFESLALPADPEKVRTASGWKAEGPLVRLHIGLEDPDDLIEDLAAGLARYGAS
ncbi:MAG TPA: PLP-dependent transferase, partial [Allosphingosinicella sp.]|nr:PLP-dependent transferase [Allosphingosinicella sp.]